MKTIIMLLLIFGIYAAFGCDYKSEIIKENNSYGKILEITCGGTVIQFLESELIGENWVDNFSRPVLTYSNCVLAGNLPTSGFNKGDTISFLYKRVSAFQNDNFCDIGGLPHIKVEFIDSIKLSK
jgi:hypothetical protein